MAKKITLFIISITAWFLLIFVLLEITKAPLLEQTRRSLKNKITIIFSNISDLNFPSRKPPATTLELEELLKANLPVPFVNFTQDNWKWFWHLLYGRFIEDSSGWPKRKRQLTQQEVQDILADSYQPFGRFTQQQWDIFWQHILKGRVF